MTRVYKLVIPKFKDKVSRLVGDFWQERPKHWSMSNDTGKLMNDMQERIASKVIPVIRSILINMRLNNFEFVEKISDARSVARIQYCWFTTAKTHSSQY